MSFLSSNQQCHSTERNTKHWSQPLAWPHHFFIHHRTPGGKVIAGCLPCAPDTLYQQMKLGEWFCTILRLHGIRYPQKKIAVIENLENFYCILKSLSFGLKQESIIQLSLHMKQSVHHLETVLNTNWLAIFTQVKLCSKTRHPGKSANQNRESK